MQKFEPVALQHLPHEEGSVQASPISWQPFLEGRLRTRAQEVALFVAERMRDPEYVRELAEIADKQSTYPSGWSPPDLASGDAGVALMYAYLDTCLPGQGFDTLNQEYLRLAAAGTRQSTLYFPALFGGTAGLAIALAASSRGGMRYQKTLAGLHQGLYEQVLTLLWQRPEREAGVSSSDFDVISGAAGVLAYLVSIEQPDESVRKAIAHLLAYLLWLGEPGQRTGQERWYISPELLPNDLHRRDFPRGNFNCGLAHGIPGPLAALALTWLAGYRAPGLRETIAYLATWIAEHRVEQEWGIDWPDSLPLEAAATRQEWKHLPATRAAWCYGAPGVARSLWLAGYALEDEGLLRLAVEAIEATLRRPVSERAIPSPIVCHGVAGLLQICLRFAHECESDLVKAQIPILTEHILEAFDPSFPLGFRNTDQEVPRDLPGWLAGASGIASVLLAATTGVPPAWDRILVIA